MTPGAGLDEAFRTVTRLRIAAFLSACDESDFRAVQEYCGLSPSLLSKNVTFLAEQGYAEVRKGHVGKVPRTWLRLTQRGRTALAHHLTALQEIADAAAGQGRALGKDRD
ncbi:MULTISPECIES: transcriptional regulator [unclassified Kitasatospora]|uniref:transcriptional regulator n=1 Tax=unclassified Kitasatospora TaxID=2633591 RepID=UPI003409412C